MDDPVAPYRLLILVLSLSLLLLTPSGAGASVHEPASATSGAWGPPAAPTVPDLPNDDHPLFIATAPAAPDNGPSGPTDEGGSDALPGPAATAALTTERCVLLLLGGAPPYRPTSTITPWPTGPPTR